MRSAALAAALAGALLAAACGGGPVAPDWQSNAFGALEAYVAAYLRGDSRVAELEFARARAEVARTGRGDLVARAELVRCAARAASLDLDDCPGYLAVAADATPPERAYAEFLAGRWQGLDAAQLPAHHRALVSGGGALAGIDDPAARLVAAGAAFRAGRIEPAGIAAAVDTASANGWRRPLLAWLGVQLKRVQQAGDGEAAARIQRRIDIVLGAEAKR